MQRGATAALRRSVGLLRPALSPNFDGPSRWRARCCSTYNTKIMDVQTEISLSKKLVQMPSQFIDKVERAHEGLDSSSQYGQLIGKQIGDNISRREKNKFLLDTLCSLKDSKEAVYGSLDAWVAWERDFPLVSLKRALLTLQKDEQWHRIVQVIKWMLSKGQGNTMGTYEQLIRALEKDHRAEEAHSIWIRKFSYDLHSAPWRVCELMISIYYRNNMLERLVKLFKGLESFEREPPNKSIVRKVADAYEILGLSEEKNRIMEKYARLFRDPSEESPRKSRKASKRLKKGGKKEQGKLEASQNSPEVNALTC